jgi:hypothetical protein
MNTFPRRSIWVEFSEETGLFQAEVYLEWAPGEGGMEYRTECYESEDDALAEWFALLELEADGPIYAPPQLVAEELADAV